MLIRNPDKEKQEMIRQAAMISLALMYSAGLAKFQKIMDGDEKYAKYMMENAKLFGFKTPRGKLTPEKIEIMSDSSKGIARLQNQSFQIFNHHDRALEIFPEIPKMGLDLVWNPDTPERLKDLIFANREKYALDNYDYPRGTHYTCNLSDKLYQNTEKSMLAAFCEKAQKLGVRRFGFYPDLSRFLSSPPPERTSFFHRGGDHALLIGGDGKLIGIKERTTLTGKFRDKSVIVSYK